MNNEFIVFIRKLRHKRQLRSLRSEWCVVPESCVRELADWCSQIFDRGKADFYKSSEYYEKMIRRGEMRIYGLQIRVGSVWAVGFDRVGMRT